MNKAIVQSGQTLLDIAIQHAGSEEGLPALAQANGLDLTSDVLPGQELFLVDVADKRVRKVYVEGGYVPASVINNGLEGISFWGIEYTFEVQ